MPLCIVTSIFTALTELGIIAGMLRMPIEKHDEVLNLKEVMAESKNQGGSLEKKPDVLILSGFLGSGKTTVLLRLIEHLQATRGDDYPIAIIENEIGSASIDSGVIADAGYSVTEMLSGCVCCTLVGQLVPALEKLADELDPQLVILEATGVAVPGTMRESIEYYSGNAVRVCTLVDASRWERIVRALSILLEGQLEAADVICVNKVDMVDERWLPTIEESVRTMNGTAPIVRMSAAETTDPMVMETILGGAI